MQGLSAREKTQNFSNDFFVLNLSFIPIIHYEGVLVGKTTGSTKSVYYSWRVSLMWNKERKWGIHPRDNSSTGDEHSNPRPSYGLSK